MNDDLHDLYQGIILDHNKRPRHYGRPAEHTHQAEGYNPLCGDKITVFLKIERETIVDAGFECASCAICKASASLMMEAVSGRSLEQADAARKRVRKLLEPGGDENELVHDELAALSGVRKFPARVKCATLPWQSYAAALENES